MKAYLDEGTTDYDTFLTQQIEVVSEAIENYCGRIFLSGTYTQTFYYDDYARKMKTLQLFHYPLTTINTIVDVNGDAIDSYRTLEDGTLTRKDGFFNTVEDTVVVNYDAGFASTPKTVESVVYSLVEERYNKKKAGIAINFGKDVQSLSIPGVMRVQFDYNLTTNDRKNGFGMILGDYLNVLDFYRSERSLTGSIVGGKYVS
jgi:hypothetical protein